MYVEGSATVLDSRTVTEESSLEILEIQEIQESVEDYGNPLRITEIPRNP